MKSPQLRFSNNGRAFPEWTTHKLKECVSFSKGGTLSKKDLDPDGTTPCVLYGELYTTYGCLAKKIISATDKSQGLVTSQKGDVLLPTSGETAEDIATATCVLSDNVAYGGDLLVLRGNIIDGPFLSYSLNSVNSKQIARVAQGKTVVHISESKIADIPITVPCKEEQQKISDFFATLDEKIELIDKKIQKCVQLRDGLITAVFEQQLRLHNDDGSSFTDWTVKTIAEVADICGGGTPSTSIHEYWDGDIQWITPSEIDSKYVHSSKRTISALGMKNSSAKPLPKGALLLTTRASIGLCSINQYEGTVCTNQGFQSLLCHSGIDPEYMYYVVTSKNFVTQMMNLASGSTFLEISSKNLKKIPISVPSYEEQRKIAQFFSLQDERIENLRAQKNALLSIKKSFMQQMFV